MLPTRHDLDAWCEAARASRPFAEYWQRLGVGQALLEAGRIGLDGDDITVPAPDRHGKVVQLVRLPLSGGAATHDVSRPPVAYPALWWHQKARQTVVVTDSVVDCLALWSIGVPALTSTGDRSTITHKLLQLSPQITVFLAPLRCDEGERWMVELSEQMLGQGFVDVRAVILDPGRSIGSELAAAPEANRRDLWKTIATKAPAFEIVQPEQETRGVASSGNTLVRRGRVVAPFIGRVVAQGESVYGGRPMVQVELLNQHGESLTVFHRTEVPFGSSLSKTRGFGADWVAPRPDLAWSWIAANSRSIQRRDFGWLLGFRGDDRSTWNSPDAVFTANGPAPQESIVMVPPNPMVRQRIPYPNRERAAKAAEALIDMFLPSHEQVVTATLMATVAMATMRRRFCPDIQRFGVVLLGHSGSGKTSRARLAACMLGDFTYDSDLLTPETIHRILLQTLRAAGDGVVVVDDISKQDWTMDLLHTAPQSRTDHSIIIGTADSTRRHTEASLGRTLHVPMGARPTMQRFTEADQFVACQKAASLFPDYTSSWLAWAMTDAAKDAFEAARERAVTDATAALERRDPHWRGMPQAPRLLDRLVAVSAFWNVMAPHLAETAGREAGPLLEMWPRVLANLAGHNLHLYWVVAEEALVIARLGHALSVGQHAIIVDGISTGDRSTAAVIVYPYSGCAARTLAELTEPDIHASKCILQTSKIKDMMPPGSDTGKMAKKLIRRGTASWDRRVVNQYDLELSPDVAVMLWSEFRKSFRLRSCAM